MCCQTGWEVGSGGYPELAATARHGIIVRLLPQASYVVDLDLWPHVASAGVVDTWGNHVVGVWIRIDA